MVFANAALFHVPSQELPRVLLELHASLKPGGVLFSSNPHGHNEEGWNGGRYGVYYDLDTWRRYVSAAGFVELSHYYRPAGLRCRVREHLTEAEMDKLRAAFKCNRHGHRDWLIKLVISGPLALGGAKGRCDLGGLHGVTRPVLLFRCPSRGRGVGCEVEAGASRRARLA
jgi:hypothetical protein